MGGRQGAVYRYLDLFHGLAQRRVGRPFLARVELDVVGSGCAMVVAFSGKARQQGGQGGGQQKRQG